MIGATPSRAPRHEVHDTTIARPRRALTGTERRAMQDLLRRHFDGVDDTQFARDLDEKDWALQIWRGDALVGFTTLQVFDIDHGGRALHVIYSGDTVVAPEAWGSPALARGWIGLVRALRARRAPGPWYWLLLSSGFRTYRFLPVFWTTFWPRHDAATPADVAALVDMLAARRFGAAYDAAAGVVRFPRPQRLRPGLVEVPDGRAADPHVHYFLRRNPGHADGDELVCLTELSDANLTAAGRRMLRATGPLELPERP